MKPIIVILFLISSLASAKSNESKIANLPEKRLYVALGKLKKEKRKSKILVFSPSNNHVQIDEIELDITGKPRGITADAKKGMLYVQFDGSLVGIDLQTNKLLDR